MTLTQVWGVLLIVVVCPLLGGLPLIEWIVRGLNGQSLRQLGTGNVSVSAAFYHGGRWVGLAAVLSEMAKGIGAVLLARYYFPADPVWEIVALIGVVIGRYWLAQGAGTTNVVWGYVAYDPIGAGLIFLIGGVGFTLLRERQAGKLGVLVLVPLITALRHPHDGSAVGATVVLSLLLAWIYQKIPDDLDLASDTVQQDSQPMFRFFRGDRALLALSQSLDVSTVGQKAAMLSQLQRWGYPVPMGWVIPPGTDAAPLIESLQPSPQQPLVVRSTAIGEDSITASAAGVYQSFLNITSRAELADAILQCQASYHSAVAAQYRKHQGTVDGGMAVLVQTQVAGVFSGVAFSRDPLLRYGNSVLIEALPGSASQVVSGQFTPNQFRVWVSESDLQVALEQTSSWVLPDSLELPLEGEGDIPPQLIRQVAFLARQLEARLHGIPQDIEWTYDGQQLWLLQARPITTLMPVWTRKIAAEVIPGFIHPLTWSINQPLTCSVWGEIFSLVLGDRAYGLDFGETATLHHSCAYFNATLLGNIFLRMGLPPESLDFLTRGAKFSKPPLLSTLRNLPGLVGLLGRELNLEDFFNRHERDYLRPGLAELTQARPEQLSVPLLLSRIEKILALLRMATYFSILAPLSFAVRQGVLKVPDDALDSGKNPEVASLRRLQALAADCRAQLSDIGSLNGDRAAVFAEIASHPEGQAFLQQFEQFLDEYGYLSEVGTDIAVPTWKDDPAPIQDLFVQLLRSPTAEPPQQTQRPQHRSWKVHQVQRRLDLKGRVAIIYNRLLAELRWAFLALERQWLNRGWLEQPGDIFFLNYEEIRQLIANDHSKLLDKLTELIAGRRNQLERDRQLQPIPSLFYGNESPMLTLSSLSSISSRTAVNRLSGIAASPGRIEGRVLVLRSLKDIPDIDRSIILVVPYTDAGWASVLAMAGGIVAEVGGRLSHGAILAREYKIPAVMDVEHATDYLKNGQWVRLDGEAGIVEVL